MNQALITVGLGYGDEGKGSVCEALVRRYKAGAVVRYNGGAQCAHCVTLDDGRRHIFAQFGSGTLYGAKTIIGPRVVFNPFVAMAEAILLHDDFGIKQQDGLNKMFIDARAVVTTPYHVALNRLRELSRNKERHGSCGMGIGETMQDWLSNPDTSLYCGDLEDKAVMVDKLDSIRSRLALEAFALDYSMACQQTVKDETAIFYEADILTAEIAGLYASFASRVHICNPDRIMEELFKCDTVVFEGAQGVLLDENYGFHPYTTWSTTTAKHAETMLDDFGFEGERTKIGVLRPYMTRHGPGPMPGENETLTRELQYSSNPFNDWQREFRVGWFDPVAIAYAIQATGGVDYLAITNMDRFATIQKPMMVDYAPEAKAALYSIPTLSFNDKAAAVEKLNVEFSCAPMDKRANFVSDRLGVPIKVISYGRTYTMKMFHADLMAVAEESIPKVVMQ